MEEKQDSLANSLETTRTAEDVKSRTATGVVSVGGQKYAVGMVWQPLQNLDDPIMEIRESAESEMGADMYCLRPATTPQYGIGRSALGHKDGMPSLAASVASALVEKASVCAVFKLEAGWWLIAIRNDLILSEEDVVFATEDEAKRAYAAMMAVPDWDLKIVPPEWNIEGTEQKDLAKLIQGVRRIRLQELNAVRRTKFLLLIAFIILAIVVYLVYLLVGVWKDVFPDKTYEPAPQPQQLAPIRPEVEKPKPWEKVPDVKDFFNHCWYNAFQLRSIIIPGWTMGTITCTPQGISTTWRLTDIKEGRLSWMKFALKNQYKIPDLKMDVDGNGTSASGIMAFTKVTQVASIPKMTPAALAEDLKEINESTGVNIQYTTQTLLDPPNRADGSVPANQKAYTYYSFTVVSPFAPQEWLGFFEKFSGLEMLKLEYTPSGDATNKWKYEGRIYAK